MKKIISLFSLALLIFHFNASAQIPNSTIDLGKVNINGNLDMLDEFSTKYTVPIEMPDGIKLMTDVTVPETQDSMTVAIPGGLHITLIPKGVQLFYYDSVNGQPNPDPFSLPIVLTRTPYDKQGDEAGRIICIFGYAYALQDMRGRYSAEGVYFPMYSDSWNKNPYHSYFKHILDYTEMNDPVNGNRHEDGYNTVQYLVNKLQRLYDVDNDGVKDTFLLCNGSLGGFGASALGNTQYQYAGAHKINPMERGIKALMPIVATLEHYRYTGYQNGVFRERIVTGWLKGQIFDVEDDLINVDNNPQDDIHTSKDYDLPKPITINNRTRDFQANKFDASTLAIDHFVRMRYEQDDGTLGLPGYYPNSNGRGDMDGSHSKVDANGESVMKGKIVNGVVVDVPDSDPDGILGFGNTARPNLTYSRYDNMDAPAYHLTGWWDIFTDGQIETWRLMKEHASPKNAALQKIIIGPWAHQTVGSTRTGDLVYHDNVTNILGFDIGADDLDKLKLEDLLRSEIVKWFRYTLNYNDFANIGLPKVKLPESRTWQELVPGISVRVPAEDYKISFNKLINFINGSGELTGLKAQIGLGSGPSTIPIADSAVIAGLLQTLGVDFEVTGDGYVILDIPPIGEPIIPNLNGDQISAAVDSADFTHIPNVRFYVIGPLYDGWAVNNTVGNYWFNSDTFPLNKYPQNDNLIRWKSMYMHESGSLNYDPPVEDEGYTVYIHDPDDQVYTIGGANMIVDLPFGYHNIAESSGRGNSRSHGQINFADPRWHHTSMDRQGVVAFETGVLTDTLCVIGYPVVTLYAKSNPGGEVDGPTDTDFFVRILDVYPPDANYPQGRQYFVVEGCVNARAREYAKALANADGVETDSIDAIPFTNIDIGKIYEFKFRAMPVGYTWGIGHKMKILISSSNHTRYQVNPNLPINDGDFFRRQPLDGQKYIFDGVEMEPRIAVQRIAHSPQYPTHVDLPIYNKNNTATGVTELKPSAGSELRVSVFPNPAVEDFNVYASNPYEKLDLAMFNSIGQEVYSASFTNELTIDATKFDKGIYIIELRNAKTKEKTTGKVTIQ